MNNKKYPVWHSISGVNISNPFKPQLLLVCILCSLLFPQLLHAAIYKCTDESGRKIFSGTPCVQGTRPVGTISEPDSAPGNVEAAEKTDRAGTANTEGLPAGVTPLVITGRVTLANGDPVAGAEVLSWGLKDKQSGFKGMARTRTDTNGSYKLSIDTRYLWIVYHHGVERREFSRKGPWQSDTTIDFIVPAE